MYMDIDKELIKRVAEVARLELSGEEEIKFIQELRDERLFSLVI